jgi:hypothetical protein
MGDGVDSNPLMSNLQRLVIILRKVNIDQLQYHLTSESHMTQEATVINGSKGAKRKGKKLCGVSCT